MNPPARNLSLLLRSNQRLARCKEKSDGSDAAADSPSLTMVSHPPLSLRPPGSQEIYRTSPSLFRCKTCFSLPKLYLNPEALPSSNIYRRTTIRWPHPGGISHAPAAGPQRIAQVHETNHMCKQAKTSSLPTVTWAYPTRPTSQHPCSTTLKQN